MTDPHEAINRAFRWKFTDDCVGEQWSKWHSETGECLACCCGGNDGTQQHQEPASYYDEDQILSSGDHAYFDPEWDEEVEYRDAQAVEELEQGLPRLGDLDTWQIFGFDR